MATGIGGFAIVNDATSVSADQAAQMVAAVQAQVTEDFASVWNLPAVKLMQFNSLDSIPQLGGWLPIHLVDTQDVEGTYGYHNPFFAEIECGPIVENGNGILDGGDSPVSRVFSHEVLETLADPDVNLWVAERAGPQFALEVCDPVQANGYFKVGVSVSDFVTPAWFGIGPGPFSKLRSIDAPFQLAPGGYCVQT
jgi:hypothetical protein